MLGNCPAKPRGQGLRLRAATPRPPLLSLLEGFAPTFWFQRQGWKCAVKTQLRNYFKLENAKVLGDGGEGVALPAPALGPFPHGSDPKGASPPGKA